MASRSFFTPPPNATTTTAEGRRTLPRQQQQQQHTTRASERLVDMNSLVWPPPPPTTQQKQRSSPSTAVPNYERRDRHPSNHVSAPTSPLGATKASSSSRRTQLPTATLPPNENRRQTTSSQAPVRQSPSSNSHLPQQRHSSQPTRPHPSVVPQHHHSNHTSPLRPSFIHSNTSPPALGQGNHHYSRRQPYHEDDGKDFSTEEEESPISHRQHRDYPQHQHHPHHQQHPSPQPHTYNNNPLPPPPGDSIPFFEPLVTDPLVTNPIPISSHHHDGYLSPVMDGRGRQINGRMCRVPPNLGPGGVIQQGWPKEYIQHAWPSVGGATGGGSRTPTMTMQSPLRYGGPTLEEEEESESSDSDSYDSQEDETDQHPPPPPTTRVVSPGRTPPLPTRRGYWNRRGDTIGETGHIRPAPPTQTFPPDLAHYPEYALMNEIGEVTLPATCVERVLSWRECRD